MSKFKAGDKVRLLGGGKFSNGSEVCTVDRVCKTVVGAEVWLRETGSWCREHRLMLDHPNPPHKHAELIKAWADGAEIQYLGLGDMWKGFRDGDQPTWSLYANYRIKPAEPTAKEKAQVELEDLKKQVAKLESTIEGM